MTEQTAIEWCDATFNPWWGCERVSPGCARCYAADWARFRGKVKNLWTRLRGEHAFQYPADAYWRTPLLWSDRARRGLLPKGTPNLDGHRPRVFCASMADVFEERDELEPHRDRLFRLIMDTPELDWLILTKRPEFMAEWLRRYFDCDGCLYGCSHNLAPDNVWLGVSIENARYTWRADVLREIPAAVRFISAEPLLGSLYDGRADGRDVDSDSAAGTGDVHVRASRDEGDADGQRDRLADGRRGLSLPARSARAGLVHERDGVRDQHDRLSRVGLYDGRRDALEDRLDGGLRSRGGDGAARDGDDGRAVRARVSSRAPLDLSGIDWVIIGGESGGKSRPFHLEHAREIIVDARTEAFRGRLSAIGAYAQTRPAVFVKQLGAKPVDVRETIVRSATDHHNDRNPGVLRVPWLLKLRDRKGGDMAEWPADRIREFPRSAA